MFLFARSSLEDFGIIMEIAKRNESVQNYFPRRTVENRSGKTEISFHRYVFNDPFFKRIKRRN